MGATCIAARAGAAPLISIAVQFTTGQYAARPWGAPARYDSHEWPPSPYRIIRAATAAWKYNLPDLGEDLFFKIVKRLASERPSFCLPKVRRTGGRRDRSGAPPPWSVGAGDALHVIWPTARLAADERATLEEVLGHVYYLGRTDSWCKMRLAGGHAARPPCRINCRPHSPRDDSASTAASPARVIVPRKDVGMDEVYRREVPSPEEVETACPDGAEAAAYLIYTT